MQTTNALLIIRCFTKYIIEIESENSLLDQLNTRRNSSESNADEAKRQTTSESSSQSASPHRFNRRKENSPKEDSHEDLNDSEADSIATFNTKCKENDTLNKLITSLIELCIEVPVE